MQQTKRPRKRRYAAPVGGLFILLAAIGLAVVILAGVTLTGRVLDNARERSKIEEFIRPVLMFDPVPFETPTDIDKTQILYYCMWATLMSEKGQSYGFDENQEMLVPASDLDAQAVQLFGPEVKLEHHTFGDSIEYSYYFDPQKQTYSVPVTIALYVYSPRVDTIEKAGDYYEVRVGYIPPTGAYTINFQGDRENPDPDKYMVYVLAKNGDSYRIVAVRDDAGSAGHTHMVQ